MPGLFDEWDKRRERATAPAGPVNVPNLTGDHLAHAQRYALAALKGEVENIAAVPIGSGRNDQLNKSAVKMGHYIAAGAIDEHLVVETLGAADGGLDYPATAKTIRSGVEAGKTAPAIIPAPQTPGPARHNPAPWETGYQEGTQSWNPFADNYAPPAAGGEATTTSSRSGGPGPGGSSTGGAAGGAVEVAPSTSPSPTDGAPDGPAQPDPAYQAAVAMEAHTQRLRRDARRLIEQEDAVREFRVPPSLPTLTDELQIPDEPVTYLVDELFPTGANVLLTAQYKTGKTTTINNLAKAIVDEQPFLGRFNVAPIDGRVALFNYEVDGRQYRRWLREIGVVNTDRVVVLNLRGYRLPLTVPHIEQWVVDWLKAHDVGVWIVDPFARAFVGAGDENDNGQVGLFLDTLDVIKERAGVRDLVMPNHTGRGEMERGAERGRGATRLDDWADVRWLLTKDKAGDRYFRATGRDVEIDEGSLSFNPATRALTFEDGGRDEAEGHRFERAILIHLSLKAGASLSSVRDAVRSQLGRADNTAVGDALARLAARGEIRIEKPDGVGGATRHFLTGEAPVVNPFGGI